MVPDFLGFEAPKEDLDFLRELAGGLEEVVEVGSLVGISALALSGAAKKVHCIDTWAGSPEGDPVGSVYHTHGPRGVFETFCRNMGDRLFSTVFPHIGTSELYASIWPRSVDLVFLDGAHDYASVCKDIEMWSRHIKPGGVLCGHDYLTRWSDGREVFPGLRRAVDERGKDGVRGTVWYKQL